MLLILSKNSNPYFNIAAEEYFLKNFKEDIFFLYININSIIVGKHQNTLSEVNYQFIKENNIPVVRRLSGGGTVFHDSGNVNFCFICNGEKGELVNFKKYTDPIVQFLQSLNINASHGGRNDILIEGSKISGNASHVFKSRVMHHGTLLYNSKLKSLTNSLKNDPLKFKDKAVKSVRSKVTNIYEHLQDKNNVNWFVNSLSEYIIKNFNCSLYEITDNDTNHIEELVKSKFNTWQWNYGYSPKYTLKKRFKSSTGKRFEVNFEVVKGIIKNASIKSNSNNTDKTKLLESIIINSEHNEDAIKAATNDVFKDWSEVKQEEFISSIF